MQLQGLPQGLLQQMAAVQAGGPQLGGPLAGAAMWELQVRSCRAEWLH